MHRMTMSEASALCDVFMNEALQRYCRDLLEDRRTDNRQAGPGSDAPRGRGGGVGRSRRSRPADMSRDEVFQHLREAGYRIAKVRGPHPYKVTHTAHPGAVFPFAAGRRFCRQQLDNYRRGFREAFGVEPPF